MGIPADVVVAVQSGLWGNNSNYNADDTIGDDYDGDLRKSASAVRVGIQTPLISCAWDHLREIECGKMTGTILCRPACRLEAQGLVNNLQTTISGAVTVVPEPE